MIDLNLKFSKLQCSEAEAEAETSPLYDQLVSYYCLCNVENKDKIFGDKMKRNVKQNTIMTHISSSIKNNVII